MQAGDFILTLTSRQGFEKKIEQLRIGRFSPCEQADDEFVLTLICLARLQPLSVQADDHCILILTASQGSDDNFEGGRAPFLSLSLPPSCASKFRINDLSSLLEQLRIVIFEVLAAVC